MPTPHALPSWLSEADLDVNVAAFEASGFRGGLNLYRNLDRNWEIQHAFAELKVAVSAFFHGWRARRGSRNSRHAGHHRSNANSRAEVMRSSLILKIAAIGVPGKMKVGLYSQCMGGNSQYHAIHRRPDLFENVQ